MENILHFTRFPRAFAPALIALVIGWLAPVAQANQFADTPEPIPQHETKGLTLVPTNITLPTQKTLSGITLTCLSSVLAGSETACTASL